MGRRRPAAAAALDGVVVVDKAAGLTSHDVVARVRRILSQPRSGHAGTLDPDATGVLVIGLGQGTRLLRYATTLEKHYTGEIVLGTTTSTLDAANEFQQLLDTAPDDARLHLALANIHAQKLGNDNEARKHYQKVLEEDPANPQAAAIRTWLATHP